MLTMNKNTRIAVINDASPVMVLSAISLLLSWDYSSWVGSHAWMALQIAQRIASPTISTTPITRVAPYSMLLTVAGEFGSALKNHTLAIAKTITPPQNIAPPFQISDFT